MVTRAEHRRATLRALGDAAVVAMEREGPDVSLERVAELAGVTRRTVYRWVDARDQLVFIHPLLWLDVFDEALVELDQSVGSSAHRPEEVEALERIRCGARAVCASVDADPEPVRRAFHLAIVHPQLFRGYASVNQRWIDRMAAEVARAGLDAFGARVVGSAIMGAIDAALAEWAAGHHEQLWPLVDAGLALIEPILRPPA